MAPRADDLCGGESVAFLGFGPGLSDLADGREAWAFFDLTSRFCLDSKLRAAAAVRKAFRLRAPFSSYQSAKCFFAVRCDWRNLRLSLNMDSG